MTVLLLVERDNGVVDELSLQAVALARTLAGGSPLQALVATAPSGSEPQGNSALAGQLGEHGVSTLHVAEHEIFDSYAPPAVAQAAVELAERLQPTAIVAAGSERGNEIHAHVAARLDLPFAANCIAATPGDPFFENAPFFDAGAHGDPLVAGVDHLFQVMVGDDFRRQFGAGADTGPAEAE